MRDTTTSRIICRFLSGRPDQDVGLFGIELARDQGLRLPRRPDRITQTLTAEQVPWATAYRRPRRAIAVDHAAGAERDHCSRREPAATAGTWLVPPGGVTVTRLGATFERVDGANLHQVTWSDGTGSELLEMTLFDPKANTMDVPDWLGLPATGTMTAQVSGIAAGFDLGDFSLDADRDKFTGIAAQPVNVP